MREELKDNNLEKVAGGKAYVDGNTMKVIFSSTGDIYQLKNCTRVDVLGVIDPLVDQYDNAAEYDAACVTALRAKGYID